jgi:hypothetical protein
MLKILQRGEEGGGVLGRRINSEKKNVRQLDQSKTRLLSEAPASLNLLNFWKE